MTTRRPVQHKLVGKLTVDTEFGTFLGDTRIRLLEAIDGRLPHSLLLEIFTDRGIGTEIVHG